jgi:DNA-binding XRE family transcriptional regulator
LKKHIHVFVGKLASASLWSVGKRSHYKDAEAVKKFGEKVREYRLRTGMTIEAFANTNDLEVTQLARIEQGKGNPSISRLFLMAKLLDVSPADLIDFPL